MNNDRYNRKIYGQRWHTMSSDTRERLREERLRTYGTGYIKPTLKYRIKKLFKNIIKRLRKI